ncbi:MAG: transglycosylase SLT domain-containing protein [Myxococcota bacterium]
MCAFEPPASMTAAGSAATLSSSLSLDDSSSTCAPAAEPADLGDISSEDARASFRKALDLTEDGKAAEALLHLAVVDRAYPELADRLALRQGELWLEAGDPEAACRAFDRATESLDGPTRARAGVGRVRCLAARDHRRAEKELRALLRRYPDLPAELELRYELARAKERAAQPKTAARMYRRLDLNHPGSGVAERARARLKALAREGVELYPLPASERVERLERMAGSSPPAKVKNALAEFEDANLSAALRSRVALVAARLARAEGRWHDARRELERARHGALPEDVTRSQVVSRARDMRDACESREAGRAKKQIARIKGRRPYRRQPVARLLKIMEIAAPAGLREPADQVLEALRAKDAPARYTFDALIGGLGTASDELVAEGFARLVDDRRRGLQARYHLARTFERLGRWAEAELELLRVIEQDQGNLGFYRMWAELRLRKVRQALVGHCGPEALNLETSADADDGVEEMGASCAEPLPEAAASSDRPQRMEGTRQPSPAAPAPTYDTASAETLASQLAPVAARWGEAYPWLPRAVALLELGDRRAASDELHEAYMAWRQAIGRRVRRAGLVAVYRGDDLPRERVTWQTLRKRRGLDLRSRDVLARVAASLQDTGVSVGFGGWATADTRPRAHGELVERAARRHGLDPNLLFAVMRVESVYQRRIISYAGAVGLMQIMPRTGRLIASQLERHDFTAADLLDPETNLEFAAWYLASLIERFDGHLPLAIASYNGGPHNVQRWIRRYSPDMPLDAFLERIPFSQTHRYVRRVLTHYAAYREQQNLPMQQLSTELPQPGPDPIGF